jgi:hypothetical protein
MVDIISGEQLKQMSNARTIGQKLENKSITQQVNNLAQSEKKKKAPKSSNIVFKGMGRAGRQPKPDVKLLEYLERKRRESEFHEYKTSIRTAVYHGLGMMERNKDHSDNFRQKLTQSRDIARILDNKLENFNWIQNENIILGLTVISKFIENRAEGCLGTVPRGGAVAPQVRASGGMPDAPVVNTDT